MLLVSETLVEISGDPMELFFGDWGGEFDILPVTFITRSKNT